MKIFYYILAYIFSSKIYKAAIHYFVLNFRSIRVLIISICIASLFLKMYHTDFQPRFFQIPNRVPGVYFVSLLEDMKDEHLNNISEYGPSELLPCIHQTLVAMDAVDELPDLTDFLKSDYNEMLGDHYRLLFDFANNHTFYTD